MIAVTIKEEEVSEEAGVIAGNIHMKNKISTVCVRCGKQRILLSKTEETVGTSIVVTTEAICPDPECQEKVSKMLNEERERRMQSEALRQERVAVRRDLKLSK